MVTEILGVVGSLARMTEKMMDLLPNYEQRKKEQFLKLKRKFEMEYVKPADEASDDLIMNLRDELIRHANTFLNELDSEEK